MMNRARPIFPDPDSLASLGLRTLLQARVLLHIARCGIQGTSVPEISAAFLGESTESIRSVVDRLEELHLVKRYRRKNARGRAGCWVATPAAWDILTTPAEFHTYPDAIQPLHTT